MIGTPKLVRLYVQPNQEERDLGGRRSLVPGFAVEVIEVEGRAKPEGGGRVFEGRTFSLTRREMKRSHAYCTPSREAIRHWWEVETYSAPVPVELLEGGETLC